MAVSGKMGKVTGLSQLVSNMATLDKAIKVAIKNAVVDTAERVRTTAIRSIQKGPKSGRVYVRGSVKHQASAPGQPPATDTGDLVGSIHRVDGDTESAVGSGLNKAPQLEFGTKAMAARPWLFPALESNRDYYNKRMKDAVKGAIIGVTSRTKK